MSLRDVTMLANVNLAAVNYHFGTKEKLIYVLAERHLGPVNDKRMAYLEKLREKYGEAPIPLEELAKSLMLPLIEALRHKQNSRTIAVRLAAQMLTDEPQRFAQFHRTFLKGAFESYTREMSRSLPHLTEQQIHARFFCIFATILGLRLLFEHMELFLQVRTEARQAEIMEAELQAFVCAALANV